MKKVTLIIYMLLNVIDSKAGSVVSVGPLSDSDCAFHTIQAAFDSGATNIDVSNAQQYNENIIIPASALDITLRGNYSSCANANNGIVTANAKTTISGINEMKSVISIESATPMRTINILYFNLKEGSGNGGFLPAGGISMVFSTDTLILTNTDIGNNSGDLGGGIFISNSSGAADTPRLIMRNSRIIFNISTSATAGGGGIYCEHGSLFVSKDSEVSNNTSVAHGGGIYAIDCQVDVAAGNSQGGFGPKGVNNNTAKIHGGGIYAIGGSRINIGKSRFFASPPGTVNDNIADADNNGTGEGGGIFASGVDTEILLTGSFIGRNKSGFHGGGIYLQSDALISTGAADFCWDDLKCNYIFANLASENDGNGGGLYMRTGAQGNIGTTIRSGIYFEANRADQGTAIYLNDEGTRLYLANSVFYKNGLNGINGYDDKFVIMAINRAQIYTIFSTFADNLSKVSTLRADNPKNFSLLASITSDIAVPPSTLPLAALSTINIADFSGFNIDCVIIPVGTGLFGDNIFKADPLFVDRFNGDLHIMAASEAVDACNDVTLSEPTVDHIDLDVDRDIRPFDYPDIVNIGGSYDMGADESTPNLVDLIFKNGFE
ncbi:MAG: hypothetical protein QM500_21160 [Methylococcales bacterium]